MLTGPPPPPTTQDDFAELQAANRALFENFLLSLQEVAGENLRNVTLQTGGKYYMVHAAPGPTPCREDEPRRGTPEENFYYPQEDFLAAQQKGKQWTWNVIRPTGIIGCTGKSPFLEVVWILATGPRWRRERSCKGRKTERRKIKEERERR